MMVEERNSKENDDIGRGIEYGVIDVVTDQ